MKKIKNFKINLRNREILRLLKATTKVSEITPQLEDAVKQEITRLSKDIVPAAIYETLTLDRIPQELKDDLPKECVAATMYAVTINTLIENDIKDANKHGENIHANILHCLAIESLEQTANFIQRLIADEAKSDSCELNPRKAIDSRAAVEKLFAVLQGDKIGVSVAQENELIPNYNSALVPLYSACGIMPWVQVKKHSSR